MKGTPMRTIAAGFVLFVFLCRGQSPDLRDRTFFLTHTATVQQFLEAATTIRTITGIQQITTDNDQKSVMVRATAGQIAMAEWLFNELDTPAVQPSVPHEYRAPNSSDDVVRVFYVTTAATIQDFQELATAVRTITNITRVFTYNAPKALVVRDTADRIQMAEWLVKELEQPASPSLHEYRVPGGNDDVVRVMFLANTGSVQAFQKAATEIRGATNITRVFTYNSPRALTVRGTAAQMDMAERMAAQLDKP